MIPNFINNTIYSNDVLFNDIPKSHLDSYSLDSFHKKEINLFNFRSDEFKKNHLGLHILFNGCSVSEGHGLLLEETWSKKLYNEINKKQSCSGYYNLSISGTSIMNQIILFFKYFKTYGNPDIIFYNITNSNRFYFYDPKKGYKSAFYSKESVPITNLLSYQYYLMLEQYCKSNNIKLFSFTWTTIYADYDKEYINIMNQFESFYKINNKDLINFIFEYKEKNKNELFYNYIEKARDNDHPGIGHNQYWANFMYDKYISLI
jgi:hypothetical protein